MKYYASLSRAFSSADWKSNNHYNLFLKNIESYLITETQNYEKRRNETTRVWERETEDGERKEEKITKTKNNGRKKQKNKKQKKSKGKTKNQKKTISIWYGINRSQK